MSCIAHVAYEQLRYFISLFICFQGGKLKLPVLLTSNFLCQPILSNPSISTLSYIPYKIHIHVSHYVRKSVKGACVMNERLFADFSSQWPEFDPEPTHMIFVVDSLAFTLRFFLHTQVSPVTAVSYARLIPPDDNFCSLPPFFPFSSPSFINFSFWFRDLLRSCVATSEVTKLLLGLVILNLFSVRSRWVCVHVLVFRSE